MKTAINPHTHEVEIDTELARLESLQGDLFLRIQNDRSGIHIFAGDKSTTVGRGERAWGMTDEAATAATPPSWYARQHAEAIASLAQHRADLARITAWHGEIAKSYAGWSRFFIVPAGHIHSSTACSTCYPTTAFGWLTALSGLTEADAVAAHGPLLCSVCYPSAPVEWTIGPVSTKTYCPGSGKSAGEGGRRYASCPDCGSWVSRLMTSGTLRKHQAPKAKAKAS